MVTIEKNTKEIVIEITTLTDKGCKFYTFPLKEYTLQIDEEHFVYRVIPKTDPLNPHMVLPMIHTIYIDSTI